MHWGEIAKTAADACSFAVKDTIHREVRLTAGEKSRSRSVRGIAELDGMLFPLRRIEDWQVTSIVGGIWNDR